MVDWGGRLTAAPDPKVNTLLPLLDDPKASAPPNWKPPRKEMHKDESTTVQMK